jgi:glycosyltransferase involved in cell wall biosynthesis
MERHRIGIVIPALNEEANIEPVVAGANRFGIPVVVDDASIDRTGQLAAAAGASVVTHAQRGGYDGALNSGFKRAAEIGCDYVITMDADGQHDTRTLEAFIAALERGAQLVAGVRDRRQRFAEHVFAWVGLRKWGLRDPLCGMKAYAVDVYRQLGHFDSYQSIGTELALFAASQRRRIEQVPVPTRQRVGEPRFGRSLSANQRILRALLMGLAKYG